MRSLAAPLTLLVLLAVPLAPRARAAGITGLRLTAVGKDSASLRVDLDEPAAAVLHWGEEPGAWAKSAESAPAGSHELTMTGLAPDRRYFYQLEIDGEPAGDVATFVSGRSWVTRKASLLATAAPPGPGTSELAERLFARESDALILLSGEGDPEAFREQHARSMADRLVATGPQSPARSFAVADVAVAWGGGSALAEERSRSGSCWGISLGEGDGADVVLTAGDSSSIRRAGETLVVTLAGLDSVALDAVSGTLTVSLATGSGTTVETITRACVAPRPASTAGVAPAGTDPDGDEHESSPDGELSGACD